MINVFSNLEMLYATYVLRGPEDGGRTIESVPAIIRDNVAQIVADAKKPEEPLNEQNA